MTASADPQQRPAHWFKPGQSGNPAGRAPGSRNKVNELFLADLKELWEAKGKAVLDETATTEPMKFAAMVASLLPKDVTISARPFTEFTDDDLRTALELLTRGPGGGGAGETLEGEATRLLPAVPEAAAVPRGGEDDA